MPREFSIVQKRKWLEAFEDGKTPAQIAEDSECDIRTVRKGIEDARWERETNLRRGELIREALTKHNESLIDTIKELLPILIPLPINQRLPWKDISRIYLIEIPGGKVEYKTSPRPDVRGVRLDIEERPEWELLDEHLRPADPLKKALSSWKKAAASHIEARISFERKLASLLKQETGLRMLEKSSVQLANIGSEAPFIDPYAVDVLAQMLLDHIIHSRDMAALADNITVTNDTEVRYDNAPLLAYASDAGAECKTNIIRVIRLPEISQDKDLADTYRIMEEAASRAKRAAQELLLLGLVPGRCRICRRLGM
jgi:hypothetical protein